MNQMNVNQTTGPTRPVPEPDMFRAAARDLQQRAEGKRKHAARNNSLLLALILVASAVLAVPTGLVFINELDWPAWLSFPIAFALHAFLAFFVHWTISHKKAGRIGASAAFAVGASLLVIAFFVVAALRANGMMEGGQSLSLAWIAALVYWLVECAIPIGLGVAFENTCEVSADERAKAVRARDFTRMIDVSGEDADGAWTDAETRLQHESEQFSVRATRFPDTITPQQYKDNEQRREWLHELWEAHPGKRFSELKHSGNRKPREETTLPETRGRVLPDLDWENSPTNELTRRDRTGDRS